MKKTKKSFTEKCTRWLGSKGSLIIHTLLFIGSFSLYFIGIDLDSILLIVTTVVSLEAIYMAIFIQMSVNKQTEQLEDVAEDIDEIQEDIDEIQEDFEEIQGEDIKMSIKVGNKEVSEDTIMLALHDYFSKIGSN